MSRSRHPIAALVAAFALVFAQFAVSTHACVPEKRLAKGEVMAHHEACHEMAAPDGVPDNGNVCAGHCQYGDASVDNSSPAPVAVDSAGPALRVEPAMPANAREASPAWRVASAATHPPPAIFFGVLRICPPGEAPGPRRSRPAVTVPGGPMHSFVPQHLARILVLGDSTTFFWVSKAL